jgi:hypothetical protein
VIANQRYNKAIAITKSDTANFGGQGTNRPLCDAIYVGGAGIVAVIFEDGTEVDFTAVAGEVLPVAAKRVNNTNTTATLMIALYAL